MPLSALSGQTPKPSSEAFCGYAQPCGPPSSVPQSYLRFLCPCGVCWWFSVFVSYLQVLCQPSEGGDAPYGVPFKGHR